MEPQIAIELLKLAAGLTQTGLDAGLDTRSASSNGPENTLEARFGDCLVVVTEHYERLLSATEK